MNVSCSCFSYFLGFSRSSYNYIGSGVRAPLFGRSYTAFHSSMSITYFHFSPPENANVNDKITETYNQNNSCVTHSSCTEGDRMENSAVKPCMSDADYERCYQEYYRYYYSHYYMHLSNGDGGEVVNEAWLVTESARAAATAASAAVNAVKQSQLVPISRQVVR